MPAGGTGWPISAGGGIKQGIPSFAALCREVERYTGAATTDHALTFVQTGYARVLEGLDPRDNRVYTWSFLQPVLDLELEAGEGDYTLPEGFNGLLFGPILAGRGRRSLEAVSVERMLELRGASDAAGEPRYFALAVRPLDENETVQSWNLMVYPAPSEDGNAWIRYACTVPAATDSEEAFPVGFPSMGPVYRLAVLAAAERDFRHTAGLYEGECQRALVGAMDRDKTMFVTDELPSIAEDG